MVFIANNLMKLFRRKKFYVDHDTNVPPERQIGSRKRPFGSLFQVAAQLEQGESVKVVVVENGKRGPAFTFVNAVPPQKTKEEERNGNEDNGCRNNGE